ncbi:MAG: threonine/serine exporter family protein [Acidimicrobiales bacterium]
MSAAPDRRRRVAVALRLGVDMLASGAQAQEVETSLRAVMRALGLPGAEAVITYGTVSVSYIAPGDAEPTTAIRVVRHWRPDVNQLAAAAALVKESRLAGPSLGRW